MLVVTRWDGKPSELDLRKEGGEGRGAGREEGGQEDKGQGRMSRREATRSGRGGGEGAKDAEGMLIKGRDG